MEDRDRACMERTKNKTSVSESNCGVFMGFLTASMDIESNREMLDYTAAGYTSDRRDGDRTHTNNKPQFWNQNSTSEPILI